MKFSKTPKTIYHLGSLRSRTIEMRVAHEVYRLVVDPCVDKYLDYEGVITFELWRENSRIHRHLRTLGELHEIFLPYKGEWIQLPCISVYGDEMERYKHPTVLEAGINKRAVTVSEFAMNLVRVKHDEEAENISISVRFIFYALAVAELLGVMKVSEFYELGGSSAE